MVVTAAMATAGGRSPRPGRRRAPWGERGEPDAEQRPARERQSAFRGLAAGRLDVAIVFEHAFEPDPPPPDVELVALFDDPPGCCSRPVTGSPGRAPSVRSSRPTPGSVPIRAPPPGWSSTSLGRAGVRPPQLHAGHGDEPVEAQAFVAAGRGITLAHRLNVLIDPERIAAVPLAGGAPGAADPGGDHARAEARRPRGPSWMR